MQKIGNDLQIDNSRSLRPLDGAAVALRVFLREVVVNRQDDPLGAAGVVAGPVDAGDRLSWLLVTPDELVEDGEGLPMAGPLPIASPLPPSRTESFSKCRRSWPFLHLQEIRIVQGDHSGCDKHPVDTKTSVAF